MMYGYGGGWIGMVVGLIVTVVIIIGVVVLAVWAVRRLSGNSGSSTSLNRTGETAQDIAKARYARGEITREEYQTISSDLGK